MNRRGRKIDAERPTRHSFRSLDLELVYHAWGDEGRPPVVLLHGFLDQGRSFDPVARRLARRHRVIAPDHRGHGRSGRVGPGGYYHFADYILDLAALVEHLGADEVALVGHSMGASIGVYYAGSFPDRVNALALLDGIGPAGGGSDQGPAAMRRWIREVDLARRREPPLMADLDDVARRLSRTSPHASRERLLEIAPHAAAPHPEGGWVWRFDELHRTRGPIPFDPGRFGAFLAAIEAPTLMVWGALTPFKPPDAGARVAAIADATVMTLPGAGHNLHHERPAELSTVLEGFLEESLSHLVM